MARTLILARHAESQWNAEWRYQGRLENDLSPEGLQQAEALRDHLASRPLTAIYTSPLRRATQTAEIVATGQARPTTHHSQLTTRNELTDVDHGHWSGLAHQEVDRRWPELSHQWRTKPGGVRFPGGESLMEVRGRALGFLDFVRHEHAEGQLLVVTHGEIVQLLLLHFLDMRPDQLWTMPAGNCAISIIEDYDVPLIMAINDNCHLDRVRSSRDAM